MNIRSLALIIFLITINLIYSCNSKQKQEAQAQQNKGPRGPLRVEGYVVQTSPISEEIQIPGTLVAEDETQIHPEVAGRIINLYIKEGAYVNKGTLLAKLYDAEIGRASCRERV